MNKHISTAAAAIALVSAIGLAYAQTSDQPADTNTTAAAQQQDAKDAVDAGTTATPDWRSPDLAAQQSNDPNAMPATSAGQSDANAPANTTGDNANATTAPADQNASANATDNGMATQQNNSTSMNTDTSTSPDTGVITERAPQADRN